MAKHFSSFAATLRKNCFGYFLGDYWKFGLLLFPASGHTAPLGHFGTYKMSNPNSKEIFLHWPVDLSVEIKSLRLKSVIIIITGNFLISKRQRFESSEKWTLTRSENWRKWSQWNNKPVCFNKKIGWKEVFKDDEQ